MRYVIHAGPTKTGSTALQGYLLANRKALRRVGVAYAPSLRGSIQHSGLVDFLREDEPAVVSFARRARAQARSREAHTVVVSGEALANLRPRKAERLAEILRAHGDADAFTVVYYARNLVDRLLSRTSQRLARSAAAARDAALLEELAHTGSPTAQISNLEAGFGADNVLVRPYVRHIERDFLRAAGIPRTAGFITVSRRNTSLDAIAARMFASLGEEYDLPRPVEVMIRNQVDCPALPRLHRRYIELVLPLVRKTDLSHPKLAPYRDMLTSVDWPDQAAQPALPAYLDHLIGLLQKARAAATPGDGPKVGG